MILPRFLPYVHFVPILVLWFVWSGCSKNETPQSIEPVAIAEASQSVSEFPTVTLKPEQAAALKIETMLIATTDGAYPVFVTGTAVPHHYGIAEVSAPIGGRIVQIYAHEGEYVRSGDVVAELESLEFSTLAADYLQAKATAEYERAQVNRYKQLVEQGATPRIELEQVEATYQRSQTNIRAAETKLKSLGITDAYLQQWASRKVNRPLLAIRAPMSGKVNEHLITLGQSVEQHAKMMDMVRTDVVMVQAFLDPAQAAQVHQGMEVIVRLPETKEAVVMKTVAVQAAMNEAQKAVSVLLEGNTINGSPKLGQQVQVELNLGNVQNTLRVPLSAIEYEGNDAFVFIQKSPTQYEQRRVTIARLLADEAILANGLNGGEHIATSQIFDLKALVRAADYSE